jgi:hypothetical protein
LIAPKVPQAAGYRSLQIRATQKVRTKRAQSVSDHIDLPEGVSFRLFFGPVQIFISCPTEVSSTNATAVVRRGVDEHANIEVDGMDSQPAQEPAWTLGGAHMARFDMARTARIHRKKHDVSATQRRLTSNARQASSDDHAARSGGTGLACAYGEGPVVSGG